MASGDMYVQWLVETLPNAETAPNAVSATAFYQPYRSFSLGATPDTDDRTDEFRGTAEPVTPDITGWQQTSGTAAGRIYPNTIGLHYFILLGAPTTTAGNGVITDPDAATIPTGATRHVWDSSTLNPAVVRSAQIRRSYGNSTGLFKIDRGVTATGLDLNIGAQNEPSTFSAALSGLYQDDIADPSLTPTYDATTVKPFYRSHFGISTWLTGSASKIDATMSFSNPVEPDPVLASSAWPVSWSRPNEAGAVPRLTGTMTAKVVDTDDFAAFLANTSFSYKLKWLHADNIAATSYKYTMWIEGAASYTGYDEDDLLHNLRTGAAIPWTAGKSGATQAFKVTLVNGVASYSSVG